MIGILEDFFQETVLNDLGEEEINNKEDEILSLQIDFDMDTSLFDGLLAPTGDYDNNSPGRNILSGTSNNNPPP